METQIPETIPSSTPVAGINAPARILLLEDDPDLQQLICDYYKPRGYDVMPHRDPTVPLSELQRAREPNQVFDLVLTDLRMPHMDGLEFIERMRKIAPKVPIVLMTAHSSVELAMKAIEAGAYDFVVKPLHFQQLSITIARALHLRQVVNENQLLRSAVKSSHSFDGVIGKSQSMKRVFDLAKRVAASAATVLITGESGTGKEVIARFIHQNSNRKNGPFIAINCSAIPENLLEAELFGYAKGAFTGAADKKIGLFEEAEDGILFLDEIGDLSLALQAKFLRVLQERKIKRVGENVFRPINVRILAATHKDLAQERRENRFREDLFFRLNVIPIKIPPLRERPEDIIPLSEHFLSRFTLENESKVRTFSKAALDHLLRLPWRGNVRELENAIERAVVLAEGSEINVQDLPQIDSTLSVLPEALRENKEKDPMNSALPASPADYPESTTELVLPSERQDLRQSTLSQGAHGSTEGNSEIASPIEGEAKTEKMGFDDYLLALPTLPTLDEFVLDYVAVVLKRVSGVKEQAARILNIDRKTLYRRIHELDKRGKNQEEILPVSAVNPPRLHSVPFTGMLKNLSIPPSSGKTGDNLSARRAL